MAKPINPLARFAVDHRVTVTMAVMGVLVLGWISLERLPLEFLPSFSSSSVTVSVPYPSSSPQEVERLIVQPLEDSLGTINGIDTLSAGATSDQAQVRLSFVDGTDMEMAAVEVRDRVDRVRHLLPSDVEQVRIRRFQSTDIPVMRFDLSANWEAERLYDFAENVVQRRLERLEGVAQVDVGGLRQPQLLVELDPNRLRAHRIDSRELATRLRENSLNVSAGHVIDGSRKLLVRAVGELQTPMDVARLPIGPNLVLSDVADVRLAFPEQEEFNYLNGREALTVAVNKVSTANLLAVAERVKTELDAIAVLPAAEGLSTNVYHDASLDVKSGLAQLRNAGLLGGALAILAVFAFLRRFRTTALVAISMPISVVATFVMLYFLRAGGFSDMTLNVISLAGLMLALGMLVDNSIVVIESIFRHRNELGEDSRTAALAGTSEVALPILASTATTMCVFLPMIFLATGRRFKLYMENIGLTVCLVILASLIVALTVIPMIASRLLRSQESRPSRLITWMTGLYGRVLHFTLHHRIAFMVLIGFMLWGSIHLFSTIEQSFGSRSLERQVNINVDTPRQYAVEDTAALYEEIYAILDPRREELGIADISYAYDRGTGRSRGGWRRSRQFSIYLVDEGETDLTTSESREAIRALLPTRPGVNLRIATSRSYGGGGGIELELSGDDPAILELLGSRVAAQLAALPGVRDVDTSLDSGDEEVHVAVSRERATQLGLSSRAVASTVSSSLSERAVSRFNTGDREIDLVMQYRAAERETLEQLRNVPVFAGGAAVPLDAIADFEIVAGPATIERENHRAQLSVSANTTDPSATFGIMRAVGGLMGSTALPPGYEWSFGRWNRRAQEDQKSGLFALAFALPLVYMLLAALFESFAQPFTIMFSVPFALLGVAVALKIANQPWDSMTLIGLIVLLGVVVNNAIVLIDHINFLRATGLAREEAIVTGGQHRLRPILITAVTTVLGLFPMVGPFLLPQIFGTVEGRAASWAPMGLVIVGGLTTSTFLTLMIIPTLYSVIDDLSRFAKRVVKAI